MSQIDNHECQLFDLLLGENVMKHLNIITGYACLLLLSFTLFTTVALARGTEGERLSSLLLNGEWEYILGNGNENAESKSNQETLTWTSVTIPGPIKEATNDTKILWARRSFHITQEQADSMSVLRWNRISCGAEAFLNGKKVGENEPTGPYQVIVPNGILKQGENQIVLKVRGLAGIRKSKSGNVMFPAGFGVGPPEIGDDIWLDFAHGAYMKWVLAIPNMDKSLVKIRVTPVGLKRIDDLEIIAQVTPWSRDIAANQSIIGEGKGTAKLVPSNDPLGGEHFFVEVPMPGFKPWTHENQSLYTAHVELRKGGKILDETTFRFGMREIGVKEKNYKLNGKNLWLRGSNLVFEWDWGDTITGKEVDYLAVEAREMSMNSFRTHTRPTNRVCSDVCDEYGTMILAEFPVLYNYQDYKFTPGEYAIWHRNVLTDSAGWMARLWNHPSVIMWVLSNESQGDNKWEETVFQDFVNRLDPTRPTMRTGTTGTQENLDLHLCGNITDTAEGLLIANKPYWFNEVGDRTLTISEYMNYFGHPYTQWSGIDDSSANDIAVAQIGAEHTEAMRRERIDAILPYMYAGWTRTRLAARVRQRGTGSAVWKSQYASPLSAAWHSSLSPVLASLDLFDPNYEVGQKVTTDLHLINDSWHDAKIHVDLLLTKEAPEWIPEAECFEHPLKRQSFDFTIKADSIGKTSVVWELPKEAGNYWLTARMTGIEGRPVLSQRFVRAVAPPSASDSLRDKTVFVLGADDTSHEFFKVMNIRTGDVASLNKNDSLPPDKNIVVIWNATQLSEKEKGLAKVLCDFVEKGGRVIVLATPSWNWPELCKVKISDEPRFSRVFMHTEHSSEIGEIDPQWLIRWNGLPGTVAYGQLEGEVMERATKILWAKEPETTVAASVSATSGNGKIIFVQLDLQGRVNRAVEHYDPVASNVLLRILDIPAK